MSVFTKNPTPLNRAELRDIMKLLVFLYTDTDSLNTIRSTASELSRYIMADGELPESLVLTADRIGAELAVRVAAICVSAACAPGTVYQSIAKKLGFHLLGKYFRIACGEHKRRESIQKIEIGGGLN